MRGVPDVPSIQFEGGAMIGSVGLPVRQDHLQTDLLCITDYISDQDRANSILGFLCDNYNIKIFGKQKVNFPHYLGQIDGTTQSQALASTIVYIDLDGDSNTVTYDGDGYAGAYFKLEHDGSSRSFDIDQQSTQDNDWLRVVSDGNNGTFCIQQNDQGTSTSC